MTIAVAIICYALAFAAGVGYGLIEERGEGMNIYVLCPVRNGVPEEARDYAIDMKARGHAVHFPPDDAPQDDPTGNAICSVHLAAMKKCDRVDVFWDVTSKGSHFDLGMAYALGKPVQIMRLYQPDIEGKSYVKVMEKMR